ncbi:hypothetical protein [Psychrobacter piscatorii]|uniref:hypothetical protein n=1 Tax=Psychrobacter piscatorii TaxID=554343 RepID=UPI00373547BB
MIESKTLGSAAGVQYQGVIDKTETNSLPSLANGVITGRFKRGRMDKPFKVTASNYQALLGRDPSNPNYLAVEDAFKRGVSEVSILRTGNSDDESSGGDGAGGGGGGGGGNLGFIKAVNNTKIDYLDGNIGGLVYSINGGEIKAEIGDLPPPISDIGSEKGFFKSMFWFFGGDDLYVSFNCFGDDGFQSWPPNDMPAGLDSEYFYLWGMDEAVLAEDLANYGMPVPDGVQVKTVSLTLYPASRKPDSNIDYDIFDLIIDPSNYTASEKQHFLDRGITPAVKNSDGSYTLNAQVVMPTVEYVPPT